MKTRRTQRGSGGAGHLGPPLQTRASEALVDVRPVKNAVAEFPLNDPTRALILEEPDWLPRSECAVKAVVWYRMLKRRGDN